MGLKPLPPGAEEGVGVSVMGGKAVMWIRESVDDGGGVGVEDNGGVGLVVCPSSSEGRAVGLRSWVIDGKSKGEVDGVMVATMVTGKGHQLIEVEMEDGVEVMVNMNGCPASGGGGMI